MNTVPRHAPGATAGEMRQRQEALIAEMWWTRHETVQALQAIDRRVAELFAALTLLHPLPVLLLRLLVQVVVLRLQVPDLEGRRWERVGQPPGMECSCE